MKEQSIEEKAKRYDEALERAKDILSYKEVRREDMEYLFPELKESEDERIRKALIHLIKQSEIKGVIRTYLGVTEKDMLVWLEKQSKKEYSVPYIETSIKDGVYLVYEDNNGKRWCELFTGNNDKENVIGVAFKFGQVSLRLYNIDIEKCDVRTKQDKPCDYVTSFAKAACDFDGKKKTEMMFERGLSCKHVIPDGWYIPSLGELYVMYFMKDAINEALTYIGQDTLEDSPYWSNTEYSATSAWTLSFGNGYFICNGKSYYSFGVRPVSAFNPLSL